MVVLNIAFSMPTLFDDEVKMSSHNNMLSEKLKALGSTGHKWL